MTAAPSAVEAQSRLYYGRACYRPISSSSDRCDQHSQLKQWYGAGAAVAGRLVTCGQRLREHNAVAGRAANRGTKNMERA